MTKTDQSIADKINTMVVISPRKNKGAALLIFLLIGMTVAMALLLKALNLSTVAPSEAAQQTVLRQAKEALIGYALSYAEINANQIPGYLPCPDQDGDGLSDAPCGNVNQSAIGRLPWRTLGLPALRDTAKECLWYAVSGNYKENPKGRLSTESSGQFLIYDNQLNSLNGANNSEVALAVVFSAGAVIDNQNRSVNNRNRTTCGSSNLADGVSRSQNYLDSHAGINNANGSYANRLLKGINISPIPTAGFSAFIYSGPEPKQQPRVFNDTLVKVTATDFLPVYQQMQRWVGERVRQCLLAYANVNANKLPWPAVLAPPANPAYSDNATQQRFGRIATNLSNTQVSGLNPMWPADPQQNTSNCFSWPWWQNFSETVFYAMDVTASPTGVPGTLKLTVDSTANNAAIIVAGRAGGTQSRRNGTEKGAIRQYLESGNIIDMGVGSIPPGDENFISKDTSAVFFNDYVCNLNACP